MTNVAPAFICPRGHPRQRPYRRPDGCGQCRAEEALAGAVAALVTAGPSLNPDEAQAAIEAVAEGTLKRSRIRDWLMARPDALRSGHSDCPAIGLRLIAELARRGHDVTQPRCMQCGRARALPTVVKGGRICPECDKWRRAEPCSSCGRIQPVAARAPDARGICLRCRTNDRSTWRTCARCGKPAPIVHDEVGRCCYVPPLLRCTVCGVNKGVRPHKTRRPVCRSCAEGAIATCSSCGSSARAGETLCTRCLQRPLSLCSVCASPTSGRTLDGTPRCPDCYERPAGACGRCGRVRPIVRLARDDDPDLCGLCWRGPVMVCERCGKVGNCRGERKSRMLCESCRPARPQPCSRCGKSRRPTAQWHEGPVCNSCYRKALKSKDQCPACGELRCLRPYAGFDVPVCGECAGEPSAHHCELCGVEDYLCERGRCARCVARRRAAELLGDDEARRRTGLEPVFAALCDASDPWAVIDWLGKRGPSVRALSRIASGEVPLSHASLDALEIEVGARAIGHLEQLLGATGALPARDQVLVKFERWCERFLAGIDRPEHAALLRTFVRWQVLRPLRQRAEERPLTESQGVSPRGTLTTMADFCTWLDGRGRSLASCRQEDIDAWFAAEAPHRHQPIRRLALWAGTRGAMPRLDVPANGSRAPALPADVGERWAIARRLVHEPGIDAIDRVAGALVLIYAQPLNRISQLRREELVVHADRVTVRFGTTAIDMPEPLASHAQELLARDTVPRKLRLADPSPWLFPGADPGRPLTETAISRRLRRLGVRSGEHRVAALAQLAAEMPPAVVADLLGISAQTANVWARLAGRPWAEYVELRGS